MAEHASSYHHSIIYSIGWCVFLFVLCEYVPTIWCCGAVVVLYVGEWSSFVPGQLKDKRDTPLNSLFSSTAIYYMQNLTTHRDVVMWICIYEYRAYTIHNNMWPFRNERPNPMHENNSYLQVLLRKTVIIFRQHGVTLWKTYSTFRYVTLKKKQDNVAKKQLARWCGEICCPFFIHIILEIIRGLCVKLRTKSKLTSIKNDCFFT